MSEVDEAGDNRSQFPRGKSARNGNSPLRVCCWSEIKIKFFRIIADSFEVYGFIIIIYFEEKYVFRANFVIYRKCRRSIVID